MVQYTGVNLAEALLAEISDPNFLPCPQITLFMNPQASLGCCGICQTTQLELPAEGRAPSDAAAAIVPCGHLACRRCMGRCLAAAARCPFCRLPLAYELCRHPLGARVLTAADLLATPATLPMGGRIPDQCRACRVATNRAAGRRLLGGLADGFRALHAQYQASGGGSQRERAAIGRRLQVLQQQFELVAKTLSSETVAALTSQW